MKRLFITLMATTIFFGWLPLAAAAEPGDFDVSILKGRDKLNQTPLGTSGKWTLERILALTPAETIALWRTLPPPPLKEMNGTYIGSRPDSATATGDAGLAPNPKLFNEKTGYWLGKSFRPLTDTTGEGYNRKRIPGGKIVRMLQFTTRIDKSLVDGKPALFIDYSPFDKDAKLTDELRKLDDSIYLGIGTLDLGNGKRGVPDAFIITGPTEEWVGIETHK